MLYTIILNKNYIHLLSMWVLYNKREKKKLVEGEERIKWKVENKMKIVSDDHWLILISKLIRKKKKVAF